MLQLIYTPRYDIRAFGLEKLHPFDALRASHAWADLKQRLGSALKQFHVDVSRPINATELQAVHTADYLSELRQSKLIAKAVEVPQAERLPSLLLDRCLLRPMRWATMGTIVAAREAISSGLAVNLAGGYHHAKPVKAEGFCFYADVALAISSLRSEQILAPSDVVAYIDLDVHQGNGICHAFLEDTTVFIFDAFNPRIYPNYDRVARERVDYPVELPSGCGDTDYLSLIESGLPPFLDSIGEGKRIALAIYNAGTDIYRGDAIGGLEVSEEGVVRRDLVVLQQLRNRGIPTLVLPSGGYSSASHRMMATTIASLIELEL